MKGLWLSLMLLPLTAQELAEPRISESPGPQRPRREAGERRERPKGERRTELSGPALERYLSHLEKKNPEEYERLSALRESDPQAFRVAMREKIQELRKRRMESARQGTPMAKPRHGAPMHQEMKQLREATTEEEKAAATEAMRAKIRSRVEERLRKREEKIERVREQLQQLEAQNAADRERVDAIVEEHLQRVLQLAGE